MAGSWAAVSRLIGVHWGSRAYKDKIRLTAAGKPRLRGMPLESGLHAIKLFMDTPPFHRVISFYVRNGQIVSEFIPGLLINGVEVLEHAEVHSVRIYGHKFSASLCVAKISIVELKTRGYTGRRPVPLLAHIRGYKPAVYLRPMLSSGDMTEGYLVNVADNVVELAPAEYSSSESGRGAMLWIERNSAENLMTMHYLSPTFSPAMGIPAGGARPDACGVRGDVRCGP
ncbi:hypothetical protein DFH08DRAFT_822809 [Mycena albidolilacea]|uniref:Uncharacterized protein n=1 Tax=Mycena albidolilacea TaxID=1033008 RepID=A0AAD6Z823_9AGAR|nr:hypothetical protein DFH08DRAFT_822809 [Mycena albidolilacea]